MRLKDLRIKNGYTQKKLSILTDIPMRTIQQYECRARNIDGASVNTLTSLAIALGVKFYDLIEDDSLREKIKMTI
jgi:transcriptional regulator with XRE-family HTH domain